MAVYDYSFMEPQWVNHFSFSANDVSFTWELWGVIKSGELVQLPLVNGRVAGGELLGSLLTAVDSVSPSSQTKTTRIDVDFTTVQLMSIQLLTSGGVTKVTTGLNILSSSSILNISGVIIALYLNEDSAPKSLGRDRSRDVVTQSSLGYVESVYLERLVANKALNPSSTELWMSSPQPVASAVVPLYLDLRTPLGEGIVVDSIDLDPVESGAFVSIYTSNDDTVLDYRLSNNFILGTSVSGGEAGEHIVVDGDVTDLTYGKILPQKRGRVFVDPADAVSFVGINEYPGLVEGLSEWSLGLAFQPLYDYGLEVSASVFGTFNFFSLNTDSCSLDVYYDGETASLIVNYTSPSVSVSYTSSFSIVLSELKWYTLIVSSDSTRLDVYVIETGTQTVGSVNQHFTSDVGIPLERFTTLTIGNNLSGTAVARAGIGYVWVRRSTFSLDSDTVLLQYARDPELFCSGLGVYDRNRVDYSAVFLAKLQETLEARVGCDSTYFEGKVWSVASTDYVLKKHNYKLRSVKAKFLKLEFTNLNPRPYRPDVMATDPYKRHVLVFPRWVEDWYLKETPIPAIGPTVFYDPYDSFDSFKAYELGLDPQLPQAIHKKFFRESKHDYGLQYVDVDNAYQYFVGLSSITLNRTQSASVAQDVREFSDSFLDQESIEETQMDFQGGYFSTSGRQSLVTKLLTTVSKVKAIQISLSSSDWIDLFGEDKTTFVDQSHTLVIGGGAIDSTLSRPDVISGTRLEIFPRRANSWDDSIDIYDSVTDTWDDFLLSGIIGGEYGLSASVQCDIVPYSSNAGRWDVEVDVEPFASLPPEWDTGLDTWDAGEVSEYGDLEQVLLRVSVGTRIYLPDTNTGTYELRLYKDGVLETRRLLPTPPLQVWTTYSVSTNLETPGVYTGEIVQTNVSSNEVFVVSFLGVFLNPLSVGYSVDGLNWTQEKTVGSGINNPHHIVSLEAETETIAFKVVSATSGVSFFGYTIVPFYKLGLPSSSADIISAENDLYSDISYYRPVERKDRFLKSTYDIPQKYLV